MKLTHVIKTIFKGKCRHCGKEVQKGEPLQGVDTQDGRKTKWYHPECAVYLMAHPELLAVKEAPPAATPAGETGAASPPESAGVVTALRMLIQDEVSRQVPAAPEIDEEALIQRVKEAVGVPTVTQVTVNVPDKEALKYDKESRHERFEDILSLALMRMNVLLIGPTGCGKTHVAEQLAETMKLPFSAVSCSAGMSEGQLLGRLLPTGEGGRFEYAPSPLVERYEQGGVFVFDELDAADANVMLVVNSALANGRMSVPNRIANPVAKKHPDFIAIGTANTFGTGADRMYVGRNQLDTASLDRFMIGQIVMGYDQKIEAALCPDEKLRTRLIDMRYKIEISRLRRVISTRLMGSAYVMARSGWGWDKLYEAITSGWTADEKSKVGGAE